MTSQHPITPPPPHLLKKFSEQAREDSKKRGHPGYCKTFAILCIEWAMNSQSTPNDRQIRSSDITPPPELVQQWGHDANLSGVPHNDEHRAYEQHIATRAAQWGADQELEACCEWVAVESIAVATELRAARRPKPPSLKEQALARLALLEKLVADLESAGLVPFHDKDDTIRRALEQLDD